MSVDVDVMEFVVMVREFDLTICSENCNSSIAGHAEVNVVSCCIELCGVYVCIDHFELRDERV